MSELDTSNASQHIWDEIVGSSCLVLSTVTNRTSSQRYEPLGFSSALVPWILQLLNVGPSTSNTCTVLLRHDSSPTFRLGGGIINVLLRSVDHRERNTKSLTVHKIFLGPSRCYCTTTSIIPEHWPYFLGLMGGGVQYISRVPCWRRLFYTASNRKCCLVKRKDCLDLSENWITALKVQFVFPIKWLLKNSNSLFLFCLESSSNTLEKTEHILLLVPLFAVPTLSRNRSLCALSMKNGLNSS